MIYTECNADTLLIKVLGIPKKKFIHLGGKPQVCKRLEKQEKCKGLVDEDPNRIQSSYLEKMKLKKESSKFEIKILHDDSQNNYLIVLCPRLEEWILKTAKEANIDVRKYNLPNDAVKLHEEINNKLDKFEKLLKDLKDSKRIKILKKYLEKREI